jgi:hypothetical protein
MKMIGKHIQWKSVLLLSMMFWLLSFQTYHVLTAHHHQEPCCEHEHHKHHKHQHDAATDANEQHGEEDCEICKIISLPFDVAETFHFQIKTNDHRIDYLVFGEVVYLDQVYGQARGRAPPVG